MGWLLWGGGRGQGSPLNEGWRRNRQRRRAAGLAGSAWHAARAGATPTNAHRMCRGEGPSAGGGSAAGRGPREAAQLAPRLGRGGGTKLFYWRLGSGWGAAAAPGGGGGAVGRTARPLPSLQTRRPRGWAPAPARVRGGGVPRPPRLRRRRRVGSKPASA
ncbi:MAG: hypothetical protein J3K34DRAFT_80325 [Monoraphidium minutum]|nr:MAG: hypothetical protein J3K34DRAFT_80325 [Monoraphidium minutum]